MDDKKYVDKENTTNVSTTFDVETKVRKKPGPKPKKEQMKENESFSQGTSASPLEPLDYDTVIKVLDDAKGKIERLKEKNRVPPFYRKKRFSDLIPILVPAVFLIILGIQFIMLFLS